MNDGRGFSLALLALAAVTLYVASRTAAGALSRGRGAGGGGDRPGLRAVGHWLPVAITALVALRLGRPEIAVALAFSTSVAGLSFVLGVLTYISPVEHPPASRRAWPFALPAALLALVAGFSGQLTWLHALALLALGGAILSAWREASARAVAETVAETAGATQADDESSGAQRAAPVWVAAAEILLAGALAVVGGWAAVEVATQTAATVPLVSARLVTVAVLTPLLTLPMLTSAPPQRAAAHTSSMASTVVALALLNLCALLPLLTVAWYVGGGFAGAGATTAATAAATAPSEGLLASLATHATPLPFPLVTWRIDAVVLTVLGFGLIPVGLGRWELGRWEAMGLVAGYALYLVVSAAVSARA
jgi:Ca2+/Na+ antiporter